MNTTQTNGHSANPSPEEIRRLTDEIRAQGLSRMKDKEPVVSAPSQLPASASRILDAIGDEVLMSKEIAKRLGINPESSTLREELSKLRKAGVLLHTQGEGYRASGLSIHEATRPKPAPLDLHQLADHLEQLKAVLVQLEDIRRLLAGPDPATNADTPPSR